MVYGILSYHVFCFQALVVAREKESDTEDHLLKIAQREEGRLKQEVTRLQKEMGEIKEKKNSFEVSDLNNCDAPELNVHYVIILKQVSCSMDEN